VESKTGPDVIQMLHFWPHLYTDACVDVSDIAEPLGKRDGGYYDQIRDACRVNGVWRGVPLGFVALNNAWRVDWFRQNDILKFPDTWEDYLKAGRKLKAFGKPIGQAFGHSFGDPNAFCYPLLWSFGAKEVEKDGKTLALDSKDTRESIKFCTAFFKEACDPGGLAWDDTSNNRAYLAGTISSSLNGASIYFSAKNQFPKIAEVTDHDPLPKGPAGRFQWHLVQHHSVMTYSKNQTAAREWIRWLMERPQWDRWFTIQRGYTTGPTRFWEDNKLWESDRKIITYRDVNKYGKNPGFPGPPSRAAGEALAKYIIVDMYARAIQGASPDDAVKWAMGELRQIYGKKA
jgi:multiple sugar transport system substrate-binding protein